MVTLTICLTLLFTAVTAQELIVKGANPNLYLVHKVVPKENWYSVGRLYNVNAKELAKYNAIPVEKGLTIDQVIKIPLTAANLLSEKVGLTKDESSVPLYHVVDKSEGLYRIATNAGTTMQNLRVYNKLTSDVVSTGNKIIVAYLKVKTAESSLAAKSASPAAEPPVVVKDEPVVPAPIKEDPKPIVTTPKAPAPVVQETPPAKTGNADEGYFKAEYQKQSSYGQSRTTVTVNGAAFKTMAGWADGKFYALMDGVPAGSIVQLTNATNNKTIYAKILGEMQEIKQNSGLKIRISTAAASALDISEENFEITVKY